MFEMTEGMCNGAIWRLDKNTGLHLRRELKMEGANLKSSVQRGRVEVVVGKLAPVMCGGCLED